MENVIKFSKYFELGTKINFINYCVLCTRNSVLQNLLPTKYKNHSTLQHSQKGVQQNMYTLKKCVQQNMYTFLGWMIQKALV